MAITSKEKDFKSANVLVVDDDEIILIALSETLRHEGYKATTTQSPTQALEYLKEQPFAVIISDQRMAEMTGLEFLQKAAVIQPNASRILITGVLTLKTVIDAINSGEIFRFIAKPWLREELLATIRNAAQRYELLEANRKLQQNTLSLNEKLSTTNRELQNKIKELLEQKKELASTHDKLRKNFEHSLDLVQRIIGVYHPALGDETRNVTKLCERMLEFSSMSEEDKHLTRIAARLHNIGLIGIPRELLERARKTPATLSNEDKSVMESNAAYGQMLAHYVDESDNIGRIIRACHERWDGKGYPDGLKGDKLPRPARLLAIASWYAESPLPKEERIDEVLHLSGSAFDNETVKIFLKAVRSKPKQRNAREVPLQDLRPGMMLAKGLYSPEGMLLLPEGHMLTEESLKRVVENKATRESGGMTVYS